jgi:hypothetical protein
MFCFIFGVIFLGANGLGSRMDKYNLLYLYIFIEIIYFVCGYISIIGFACWDVRRSKRSWSRVVPLRVPAAEMADRSLLKLSSFHSGFLIFKQWLI